MEETIVCFASFEQFIKEYQLNQEELTIILPAVNSDEIINGLTSRFNRLFIDRVKIKDNEFFVISASK